MFQPSIRLVLIIGLCPVIIAMLTLGLLGIDTLDSLFFPDDTYYTLMISRNIALNQGPTCDGKILTSGFQPLISVFQIPVFLAGGKLNTPIVAAVWTSAISGILSILLLGLIIARETSSAWTVFLTMSVAGTTPVLLGNSLNGLETSLSSFLALLIICLTVKIKADASTRILVTLGIVCGFSLLARIDNCFLVSMIGLWVMYRIPIRRFLIIPATAALIVAPWWIWCTITFGSPIPESGAAVRLITEYYRSLGLGHGIIAILTAHAITLIGGGTPAGLISVVTMIVVLSCLVITLFLGIRQHRMNSAILLGMTTIIMVSFYTFYLPAYWFFERYFHLPYLSLLIISAISLHTLQHHFVQNQRFIRVILVLMAITLLASNIWQLILLTDPGNFSRLAHAPKGYSYPAKQIISRLPDGAILGAMQSGALGWFAERGIRVVNLDGVVNRNARKAIETNTMAEYIKHEGITHISDWEANISMLLHHSGLSTQDAFLHKIGVVSHPGQKQFKLYRVNY